MLSENIKKLEESGIRKVFKMAMSLDKKKSINLSIGQPHFEVSKELKELATEAINDDYNSYFPTEGYLPLRKKICKKLKEKNNIDADEDDVIVTAGVSGAIHLLFSSIINEGDEVILPDPYFVLYEQIMKLLGAKIVYLDTYPDFRINPQKLESLISNKTKLLIINSPNNPTGIVYSESELKEVAQVASKHGLLVMSDEIYEDFDFDKKFFSIGSIYDNTVTLNGFSKNLAITGWRLGYAHGPKEIIEAMNKLQMYTYVCAPSFAQLAVSQLDEIKTGFDYRKNRDLVLERLKDKYEFNIPEGAFYAYIKIPEGKKDFLDQLYKENVLVIPGGVFSQKTGYFRLSFAVNEMELRRGLEVFKKLV
ncbi:aspartate aminotransferase [Candidatus Parcubacteria bacterium]|nr:MAG: aspartate aminotransferase [Candidatus Parcubacteria bacterium]